MTPNVNGSALPAEGGAIRADDNGYTTGRPIYKLVPNVRALQLSVTLLPPFKHQIPSTTLVLTHPSATRHQRVAAGAHHHEGHGPRARFLIVQDGGLYYQGRTMGFEFAVQPGNPEP